MTVRQDELANILADVNMLRGQLMGRISMFGFEEQNESLLEAMTSEIVHSSKIEGQELNRDSVRSSLASQLGLKYDGLPVTDHYVEGVVQVMLDATHNFMQPLTDERLFAWHCASTRRNGIRYATARRTPPHATSRILWKREYCERRTRAGGILIMS